VVLGGWPPTVCFRLWIGDKAFCQAQEDFWLQTPEMARESVRNLALFCVGRGGQRYVDLILYGHSRIIFVNGALVHW
jgi:hypothetical protein